MVQLSKTTISKGNDGPRLDDLFDMLEFPNTAMKTLRPVGDLKIRATHWVTIRSKEGAEHRIPVTCINVDTEGKTDPDKGCKFCAVNHKNRFGYYWNVIDSTLANAGPPRNAAPPTKKERQTGFKDKSSNTWTPCRVWGPFPVTVAETLQTLTKANKNKKGEDRELSDPIAGRALDVANNKKATSPAGYWNIQRAEDRWAKLSEEERGYMMYDLNLLDKLLMTSKASEARLRNLLPMMVESEREELDLTDYQDVLAKANSNKKSSKRGSFEVDSGDDDDDTIAPRKRRRSSNDGDDRVARKSGRREIEAEAPRKKKKRPVEVEEAPVRRKKKRKLIR